MAKKFELHERGTNDVIYPITKPDCVLVDEDNTLKDWMDEKDVTPYPNENEMVYTTIDNKPIEKFGEHIYYSDKGFGVISTNKLASTNDLPTLKTLHINMNVAANYNLGDCIQRNINLESVIIEGNLKVISVRAICNNPKLSKLVLPDSVNSISNLKSLEYNNLDTFNLSNLTKSLPSLSGNPIREITIPGGVDPTGVYYGSSGGSYSNCLFLSKVTFNNYSGDACPTFFNCINLKEITIPNSIRTFYKDNFNGCISLTKLNIPNGVTTIPDNFVRFCSNLKTITIPNTVTEIGNDSFSNCISLKTIDIPINVKHIGILSFSDCTGVDNIIFRMKDGVIIDNNAFKNTYPSIIEITELSYIPSNFVSINNLKTLVLRTNKVIEDVDAYVSTFTLEEGQHLPEGAKLLPKPESEISPISEDGIMPLTNLDTYIGTPNNWLKIFVPNNLLKKYQERYPTLKNHFHPIQGEDIYATKDELPKEWYGTQEEYDALGTYDEDTKYYILEN